MTARLSDEEFWYLLQMLQRYTETDMDQWDRWRLRTACGPVYVRISRRLPQDEPEQAFRALEVPLAARHRTGRPARPRQRSRAGQYACQPSADHRGDGR